MGSQIAEYFRTQATGRADDAEANAREILELLVDAYRIPGDWLGTRLKVSGAPGGARRIDLCHPSGVPYCVILAGDGGVRGGSLELELRKLLAEEESILVAGHSNGTAAGTGFLRKNSYTGKFEYVDDLEAYAGPRRGAVSRPFAAGPSGPDAQKLVPMGFDMENVFFDLHCALRDIDGLHPDEALDELCKVLYAKLYDEEQARSGGELRFQRGLYGSSDECGSAVRLLYGEARDYDLRVFRLKIDGCERSRGVFSSPIRISSQAVSRIVEILQNYSLSESEADIKGRAFQRVLDPTFRQGLGQYFTPDPIVELIVGALAPKAADLILDPFCGSAHFLSKALEFVKSGQGAGRDKACHEFASGKLHGIEKNDRMVRVAMTDMRLHGDGHSNIRCTDALLSFDNYRGIMPNSFDLVLTNPPFGSLLPAEVIARLGAFELAPEKRNVPLEILGLERSVQFLRPGGRLGIVLPDSVFTNRNTGPVRDWMAAALAVDAIVSLPVETFSPFGANIKTSILFGTKALPGRTPKGGRTLLMRIDNIGYDASGRKVQGSEIGEAMRVLREFLDARR